MKILKRIVLSFLALALIVAASVVSGSYAVRIPEHTTSFQSKTETSAFHESTAFPKTSAPIRYTAPTTRFNVTDSGTTGKTTSAYTSVETEVPTSNKTTTEKPTTSRTQKTTTEKPSTTEMMTASRQTSHSSETTSTPTTQTSATTTAPTTTTTQASTALSVSLRYAQNAVLYDLQDDRILYKMNINTLVFPASTTKLLTACVALVHLDEDEILTVGSEINLLGQDSSVCGLKEGMRIKVKDLIYGLLIPSGNDAAYTLAVNTARKMSGNASMSNTDAVNYFATLMNNYAKNLGAIHSNFMNPDGYHNVRHYTTVSDLLLITKKAMSIPLIKNACSTARVNIKTESGQTLRLENTNYLILPDSKYYYKNATGLKTGYTVNAGYCLVATADIGGKTYVSIVMGCSGNEKRFADTITLFNAIKN